MNTSAATTPTPSNSSSTHFVSAGLSTNTMTGSSNNNQLSSETNAITNIFEIGNMDVSMCMLKDDPLSEWAPPFPQLCAYHDASSLAAGWGIGPPITSLETARPTGASQAQSPDDAGDGKTNELVLSCPAFRNELGVERIRKIALSRNNSPTKMNNKKILSIDDDIETWHREHTASEIGVLEDVSNVYLGGRLCANRQSKFVIEPQDIGSYYFRHCFAGRAHVEYFGTDEFGPMAISMIRETTEKKETTTGIVSQIIYRMIVRISDLITLRVVVPDDALSDSINVERSSRNLMRELLEIVCPQVHFGCLRPAIISPKVEELLLKIDEQPIYTRYKVGIMFCRAGQSTEEQMYNNEHSSPAFEEFLDFLGTRVRLKGFEAYKGGLDTRGDTTGLESIFTEYHSSSHTHEVMFHVSTMLPFTPNNKQQLSRKRHIGNDMVTIIFQEPDALPFSPITVRSHFQHVFIIIRVVKPCTENVSYRVAVSRAKDVPAFGPPIKHGANYQKCAEFHDFLLTKIINAENAVHRSKKFLAMAARTRREALKDLAENYVTTHHSNEGPARIASRFLGGSVKRKERQLPKPTLGANIRGALSWMVEVYDNFFQQRINCILGLSSDSLILLEIPNGMVLFATPTHSLLGWANTDTDLKIYFDHSDVLFIKNVVSNEADKRINTLLKRLEAVTNGEEAKELILRKNKPTDSLGFHIQEEGVVTDVEMYQIAWKTGLRQGSRIVEIDNIPVVTLTLEQMKAIFEDKSQIRILMIAPTSDGNPRRGCEDPCCPAIKGQDLQVLTPDTFAKQPLTYQEMLKMRSTELSNSLDLPENSNNFLTKKNNENIRASSDNIKNLLYDNRNCNTSTQQHRIEEEPILKKDEQLQQAEKLSSKTGSRQELNKVINSGKQQKNSNEMQNFNLNNEKIIKYQELIKKISHEKRNLELINENLKQQLLAEQKSHNFTRKKLQLLQAYYDSTTKKKQQQQSVIEKDEQL